MFLLKKIVSQLFMPVPLLIILMMLSLLMFRHPKWAKKGLVMALSLLVVLSSNAGSGALLAPLEAQYAVNNEPLTTGCVVMVLGSGHTEALGRTAVQQLSTTALARLSEGIRQLSLGSHCQLVVSGWSGGNNTRAHAAVMFDAAVELGVPADVIISSPLAKDTIEEAQFMRDLLAAETFRLVTSASHMPRAMMIFEGAGLNAIAAPTDFAQNQSHWWVFNAAHLLSSQKAIHEYLGILWIKLNDPFKL
ncbi:YdcF family protein [Shewanella sp.]|nr:YdcF family protein [Shewanella sp.]